MHPEDIPNKNKIITAHQRIAPTIHKTPVLSSRRINNLVGAELFFKAENLQKGGSFKIRGASNALFSLSKEELKKGVATHSSGNHAQALALAAQYHQVKAHIVMPENAPQVKVRAVREYGAEITFCASNLKAREETLEQIISKTGANFIPPYNHYAIICGQATMTKELIEDHPDLEAAFIPIGGGGLISGAIIAAKHFNPDMKIIGAEPERANDAYLSWKRGELIPVENPDTIADGLRTSLGNLTFPIINEGVEDIITVTEEEIIEAMKIIYLYLKQVVEPSAAVPLAAIIKEKTKFQSKKLGLVLCGGNIDLENLPF